MIVVFHKEFEKAFKKLDQKFQSKFRERLVLFERDEFDPVLNNHALKGRYLGYRSINITGDICVVFKRESESALFVVIDNHSNLYG